MRGLLSVLDAARCFPPESPLPSLAVFLLESSGGAIQVLDVSRSSARKEITAVLGGIAAELPIPGGVVIVSAKGEPSNWLASTVGAFQACSSLLWLWRVLLPPPFRSIFRFVLGNLPFTQMAGKPVNGSAVALCGERGQHLYNCLRQEMVHQSPVPLSPDAFSLFGRHAAPVHCAEVRECTNSA